MLDASFKQIPRTRTGSNRAHLVSFHARCPRFIRSSSISLIRNIALFHVTYSAFRFPLIPVTISLSSAFQVFISEPLYGISCHLRHLWVEIIPHTCIVISSYFASYVQLWMSDAFSPFFAAPTVLQCSLLLLVSYPGQLLTFVGVDTICILPRYLLIWREFGVLIIAQNCFPVRNSRSVWIFHVRKGSQNLNFNNN